MSQSLKKLSAFEARATVRYPCDGVRRYEVHGIRIGMLMTYSEAWEAVLRQSKAYRDKDVAGGIVFNKEAIRRLGILNRAYKSSAAQFLDSYVPPQPIEPPTNESAPAEQPSEENAAPIVEPRAAEAMACSEGSAPGDDHGDGDGVRAP